MKKSIFSLGLAAICAIALTGCVKEIVDTPIANEKAEGIVPFELTLNLAATKTSTDDALKNAWDEGDAICLFHAEAGSANYINDGKFTVKEAGANGVFAGKLVQMLDPTKAYDWYAVFPYKDSYTDPKAISIVYREDVIGKNGAASDGGTENICNLPLYSSAKNVAVGEDLALTMHQFFSLAKLTIKNVNYGSAIAVNNFGFAPVKTLASDPDGHALYGDFTADITADKAVMTTPGGYLPQNAQVNFYGKGYTIAQGESRTHYLPVFPNTLVAGTRLSFFVKEQGDNAKIITLKKDLVFNAGEVTEFNVNLDKDLYITEEEMAEPVKFRCCYIDRDKLTNYWTGTNKTPRFLSVLDHDSVALPYNANLDTTIPYGKAYISVSGPISDNGNYGDNTGRYYLVGCSPSKIEPRQDVLINANYAKIPAGYNVSFYSSILVSNNENSEYRYSFWYTVNGGPEKPAKVVLAGSDIVDEDGIVTLSRPYMYACHPIILKTGPMTEDMTNAKIVFKVRQEGVGSFMAFAPYYEWNLMEGYRNYCKVAKAQDGNNKAAWEWIATATWDKTADNRKIDYPGDFDDITGCFYLTVGTDLVDSINSNGGIDPWVPGSSYDFSSKE